MATNYNDFNQCYANFRRFNKFNLKLVYKLDSLAYDSYDNVKIRVLSYNNLYMSIEISAPFYETVYKRRASENQLNYVEIFQIDSSSGNKVNNNFYYIESLEVTEDLQHILHLKQDLIRNYYSLIQNLYVIIENESIPSANTKYSGQKTTFSWIGDGTPMRLKIQSFFPYLSERDNSRSIRNILISIASNRVFDADYGQYYEKSMPIGSQFYSISANVLREISKKLSTKTFFDDLKETLLGGDMKNAILSIRKYPFEIQGEVNPPEFPMYIGGSDKYIDLTSELRDETRYFSNYRYVMSSDAIRGYVESKYYIPDIAPFNFTYNVNQVDRMELHLPFVDIDLSNFIEYFEGNFSAGYIIDVYSGKGCLGIVKGNKFNPKLYTTISTDEDTPFDIVVPIELGQQIEWTVTESNEVSRALSLAASAYGLMNGNVGAAFVGINHLFSDPTTITPHSATSPSGAENMSIYGLMQHYGLKVVGKSIGIENNGFKHERMLFSDIPNQQNQPYPGAQTYNIQKMRINNIDITPYEEVNKEIARILADDGIIKNTQ